MKRFDEALALAPRRPPRTRDDWIAAHIRGMIFVHQGNYEEVVEIFSLGMRECPFASSVAYFRTALALAQLRQKEYRDAELTLADATGDVAEVLRFHVEGEQGHIEKARDTHRRLVGSRRRRIIELRDEFAAAYLSPQSSATVRTPQWHEHILDLACELITMGIAA